MANGIEHSRHMSEALLLAVQALRFEASSLRSSLDTDTSLKAGSVQRIINSKIEENEQAADLLEGSLKRCAHHDVKKRERENGNPLFRIA